MDIATLGSNDAKTGAHAPPPLLGGTATAMDALPLFKDAMDRIAEACDPRFEKIAGENMTVICSLASLTTEIASDVITGVDPTATTALFEMPSIDSRVLVSLEDDLLQFVIELMCGGTCSEPPSTKRRAGTSIDRQFARIVFNLLRSTIEKECLAFGMGEVLFDQIHTKFDASALGKRSSKVSVATIAVECLGRRGTFRLAFPQSVTDRFKQDSLPAAKPASVSDPDWTERFQAEIGRTVVSLDAFLAADSLTLGEVANLEIGQILSLPKTAPSRCELRCDDKLLFRCELGQADGHYSLRIEETQPRKDAADATLADTSPLFDLS